MLRLNPSYSLPRTPSWSEPSDEDPEDEQVADTQEEPEEEGADANDADDTDSQGTTLLWGADGMNDRVLDLGGYDNVEFVDSDKEGVAMFSGAAEE